MDYTCGIVEVRDNADFVLSDFYAESGPYMIMISGDGHAGRRGHVSIPVQRGAPLKSGEEELCVMAKKYPGRLRWPVKLPSHSRRCFMSLQRWCLSFFLVDDLPCFLRRGGDSGTAPVYLGGAGAGESDDRRQAGRLGFIRRNSPSYEFVETAERRHCRTAMMYDADNLYLEVTYHDDTPMMNMVDGHVDKSRGWDADGFQLRMVVDPALTHPLKIDKPAPVARDLIFWYFTGKKEPSLAIHTVTLNQVLSMQYDFEHPAMYFDEDARLAFAKTADGYIMEAAIPWKRLDMPGAPKPGSKVAMTMQALWGNDTGTRYATSINDITNPGGGFTYQSAGGWGYAQFEPAGHLARAREELPKPLEVVKTLSFSYQLPEARRVSLGLFDANGQLVRTLLTADPRPAGTVEEQWDGLNDFGDVLPAGKYSYKALTRGEVKQHWVVSLHNPGNPPWVTADGKGSWGGDHGVPLDAACSQDRVFLVWDYAEAGWNLIGCTLDGQKQWGTWVYQNYPAPVAIATDGKLVYVCQQAGITANECATGKPVSFAGNKRGIDIEGGGASDIVYRNGHLYALAKGKIFDIQLDQAQVVRSYPAGGDERPGTGAE